MPKSRFGKSYTNTNTNSNSNSKGPSFGSSFGSSIGSGMGLGAGSEMAHQAVRGIFDSGEVTSSTPHPSTSDAVEREKDNDICGKMARKCLQACLQEEQSEKCHALTQAYRDLCASKTEQNHYFRNIFDDGSFEILKQSH